MTAEEMRAMAVAALRMRLGMNTYTQGDKRAYVFGYPDNDIKKTSQKGYGDCSSTARKVIKYAAGIDIGSNTSAQITNRAKGIIVHEPKDGVPDESKYTLADCLYFKSNDDHPMGVQHVEIYTGKNELIGHGSGTGPVVHDMKKYCADRQKKGRGLFMVIRWIKDDTNIEGFTTLARGDHGNRVTELQGMLLQLGYDLGSYGMDGDYGTATENAVKAFQTNARLTASGIVNEVTWVTMKAMVSGIGDAVEDDMSEVITPEGNITLKDGKWNLRVAPGTEYDIAETVSGADRLVEVKTDWVPVLRGNRVLWISSAAIKK